MDIGCSGMTWESCGRHFLGRTVDRAGESSEHYITAIGRGVKCARRLVGDRNCGTGRFAYAGLTIDVEKIITNSEKVWVDGINERGLMIALLNVPLESKKISVNSSADSIHPARIIPHILSRCETVEMAAVMLEQMTAEDDELPMQAHFLLCDSGGESVVAEPNGCGFTVYHHTDGVLTNAPEYTRHIENLKKYREGRVYFPDDFSSESRFVRLSQIKNRFAEAKNEADATSGLLEALCAITVPKGADERAQYRTMFRTVMSAESRTYYLTSAENHRVKAVQVRDLRDNEVKEWKVDEKEDFDWLK